MKVDQQTNIAVGQPRARTENQLFVPYPRAWFYFGTVRELSRGPVVREIIGKRLVGFVTGSGQAGVLSSNCVHMGADLGNGEVVGETLQCPLHNWCFETDGRCSAIPASSEIPSFAKQTGYPTAVRNGCVYFFNAQAADYSLPFFDGFESADLVASKPFTEIVACPWYMIGANAIDVQHFSIAHDRRMQKPPEVNYPHPNVHRTVCHFEIAGDSLFDKVTERFGGKEIRLEIVDWSSTMILARSTLKKTETLGMLSLVPLGPTQTMGHVTVFAKASENRLQRRLLDPLRAGVRRILIRAFLRSDVGRLSGSRYSPGTLIEIDSQFGEYFDWLGGLNRLEQQQ